MPDPMPTPREFTTEILTLLGICAARMTGRIPERWEWPADAVQAVDELLEAVAVTGPRVDALELVAITAVDVVRPQSIHSRFGAESRLARALYLLEQAPGGGPMLPEALRDRIQDALQAEASAGRGVDAA